MSYALFANDIKVSRAFPSKSEVWQHATDSGLVMELSSREEDPPRRVLDMGYAIHECPSDQAETSTAPGMSEYEISQLIAACTASPRSATAAS